MSRFANFIKSVASPFVDDRPPKESEKRSRVRGRRRERYNSPDTSNKAERGKSTRKDDGDGPIDRLVTVNEDVRDNIRGNARSKPYDPVFLRDISANAVVQAYIDTLSQDVSSTEWSIKARDEDADISDEALAEVERHLKQLPPGNQTFADMLEATTRVLLELGDGTIVKHYYEDDPERLAELVVVDSASLFKMVDEHGIPEGYVQISKRGGTLAHEFDVDDVIWCEWSNRPDRFYGQGPLEKAQNEVELIEELAEKERLDLIQGGPPGVLSPEALDEYGGLPNDEDWETFVEDMRLDAGERHRVGYSKTPVNFESVNHNYQELQILDRSKYWVTVIGSVFKVNPSYAGFDFENQNRATDESQRESFKQRGFRVTLRQLEESLNRGLIWSDISEDVMLEFTKEQTIDERRDRASLIEDQASAGKEMANAGRNVSIRDGRLVVDDGELEEGDVGGGGGGGGLFGSVDDPDDADLAVDATPSSTPDRKGKTRKNGDDGIRLHYPAGGVAHSSDEQYAGFLEDVASNGGRIIDTKGFSNGNDRVWPPEEPDPHDPRMVVYGLSEVDVLALLDRYPDVGLVINTDHDANAKSAVSKEVPQSVVDTIGEDRFVPPEGAASNAEEALRLIDEHGRDEAPGGTEEAIGRARQIIEHVQAGDPLVGTNADGTPFVVEIANFFARHRAQGNHEFDSDEHDAKYEDPGWLADMLWGGDAAQSWSSSLADAIDEAEEADAGDSGNGRVGDGERLSKEQVAKLDEVLLRAHTRQIAPPSLDAIEKDAWSSDEDVPNYVVDQIRDVVDRGAVFDDFKSLPGRVADVITDTLEDALTQPQGWSLDSIVGNMSEQLPRADPADLETIARTESASVLNEAREDGYRDRGLDDAKFKWVGPSDERTTDACEEMKDDTNPSHGGDPVSLPKLINKEEAVQAREFPNLDFRKHVIHPNERHTFVRATDTGDDSIDVDVPSAEDMGDAFEADDTPVDPQDFGPEYDKSINHDHDDSYADVIRRVEKATNVTRRVGQIEDALGSPLPVVLRSCLEDAGSTRGAHRKLNERLAESDEWDIDDMGRVSTATIYEWADRYSGHLSHLT